ncbi:hypothetical protein B0T14DRAFT_517925 [Immersiella caudata]|uniref:Uncharacterized protein n=1 Tax=Immersiella caudata TaxID=314043 RepID=A0AA40C3T7_9PEZI|nr:hypothetical protein B0T14DRAFT_517925 [Immersiella caudata]
MTANDNNLPAPRTPTTTHVNAGYQSSPINLVSPVETEPTIPNGPSALRQNKHGSPEPSRPAGRPSRC